MTTTAVTFHHGDELLLRVDLPAERPCTIEFPVPSDWVIHTQVDATTWDADGNMVEQLRPVRVMAGDTFRVTVEAPQLVDEQEASLSRTFVEAWFAAERARTCEPDCPDCAKLNGASQ